MNKIERIPVFVGKDFIRDRETYQILVGRKYIYAEYEGSIDRHPFYKQVSKSFTDFIFNNAEIASLVVIRNGRRIDDEGNLEYVGKVDEEDLESFSRFLTEAITKKMQIRETFSPEQMN